MTPAMKGQLERIYDAFSQRSLFSIARMEKDGMTSTMVSPDSLVTVDGQIANLVALFHRPGAMNVIENVADRFGFNIGRPGDTAVLNELAVAQAESQRVF